jgi:cytochrome b561
VTKWTSTAQHYGLVAMLFHWLMAIAVVGMFSLGWWMVDLDYYHSWRKDGPDLHRSIGVLLVLVWALRLAWRIKDVSPQPLAHKGLIAGLAKMMHGLLYLLIPMTGLAGYLISTADGRGVEVFEWFTVPATFTGIENQEDLAGEVHWYLALTLIVGAGLHGLAALKHHFIDKDSTLTRMLGMKR